MPYHWTNSSDSHHELQLRPHNALSPKGFATAVMGFYLAASVPIVFIIGTGLFWGLLPFMLLATWALYYGLRRNARDRSTLEVLTISDQDTRLVRTNPNGSIQDWQCNTYWAKPNLHPKGGPVPNYVTLSGSGREVEIGAFLSEEERVTLYQELRQRLSF
jgi:uncharacterized membrane protein